MSSISEILQGKGRENEKFHFSLSLPSFEQYFPRGSFTSSAFGITGLDLSSPLASSEFDSKLVVVVRLWRISRGMNHLFQEIINIINIITLSLPLTYILINILLTRLYRNIKLAFEEFRVSKWENENEISVERRWWIGMELDFTSNGGSKVCFWIEL